MAFLGSMAGFAGSGFQSIYSATKAFDWILAEGLWHELGIHGVDVVALVLGATATASHEAMDVDFSSVSAMSPDAVAAEGLANLHSGPLYVVGEHNRAAVPFLLSEQRASIVSTVTKSSADLFGHDYRPVQ